MASTTHSTYLWALVLEEQLWMLRAPLADSAER